MKFLRIPDIFQILNNCIEFKLPFSHIRFGDGGIKFIHSILFRNVKQLNVIVEKEGLPPSKVAEIFELWGYYARRADCIDTPEVYFDGTFWPRVKTKAKTINIETEEKMRDWRELYAGAEFDNNTFCNPESNCLMILDIPGRKNILDIMKNRRICMITARPEIINMFPNFDIDVVSIVGQWENQYKNSFSYVVDYINNMATKYDFWMIAAGELGRLYSGMIKELGGRTIDIGFVIEYWLDGYIHPRFYRFVNKTVDSRLTLKLTEEGKKYERFI